MPFVRDAPPPAWSGGRLFEADAAEGLHLAVARIRVGPRSGEHTGQTRRRFAKVRLERSNLRL